MSIFNFWKKKLTESTEENDIPIINFNLTVQASGDLIFNCCWINTHPLIAKNLGNLLYHLNNGHLKGFLIKSLIDSVAGDIESMEFTSKVLECWNNMEADNDNEPVISPINALKVKHQVEEENEAS
jgi:hypothetical protein